MDAPTAGLSLDVCTVCAAVWFDRGEMESVPVVRPTPAGAPEMSPESREALALAKVQRLEKEYEASSGALGGPASGWQWAAGFLGMPVELDAPEVSRRPWATWGVALACVAATAWAFFVLFRSSGTLLPRGDWHGTPFEALGFIPSQWTRYGGATLLTSFFLHGGLFHLLGNMYFLIVFGDNVEDRLGRSRFLLLLLCGHMAGMFAHGVFAPHAETPCVGASAGISAVIAFYAVTFPDVRLGFLFRFGYMVWLRWLRIRAKWALGLYFALQMVGAYFQINGFTGTSYLGHLGGLAAGLGAVLLHGLSTRRLRRSALAVASGSSVSRR